MTQSLHIGYWKFDFYRQSVKSLICILILLTVCQLAFTQSKMNGISFNGPRYQADLKANSFEEIKELKANWIAFVPETILNRSTLKLRPDSENHWWGKTIEGSVQAIKMAKSAGLRVMLKPQMVLDNITYPSSGLFSELIKLEDQGGKIVSDKSDGASWRGDFSPDNEADWQTWEDSYSKYILRLAIIAEDLDVDVFCLGTELKESAEQRPQFWKNLIKKVRKIYSGPITYSANWDEYSDIEFWADLDFIGTNTYYPISLSGTPKVKSTVRNWKYFKSKLKKFSEKHGKQILITEFGYRNVSYSGVRPWIHDSGKSEPNDQAQSNLYEAFFQSFWNEPWIIGGFSWNWDAVPQKKGNTDFSVQGKAAAGVLREWFGLNVDKAVSEIVKNDGLE